MPPQLTRLVRSRDAILTKRSRGWRAVGWLSSHTAETGLWNKSGAGNRTPPALFLPPDNSAQTSTVPPPRRLGRPVTLSRRMVDVYRCPGRGGRLVRPSGGDSSRVSAPYRCIRGARRSRARDGALGLRAQPGRSRAHSRSPLFARPFLLRCAPHRQRTLCISPSSPSNQIRRRSERERPHDDRN
jgi:hypothetical protein